MAVFLSPARPSGSCAENWTPYGRVRGTGRLLKKGLLACIFQQLGADPNSQTPYARPPTDLPPLNRSGYNGKNLGGRSPNGHSVVRSGTDHRNASRSRGVHPCSYGSGNCSRIVFSFCPVAAKEKNKCEYAATDQADIFINSAGNRHHAAEGIKDRNGNNVPGEFFVRQ